jgi:5-amino-6-(5-phosphoribosylamino)uracil reductase/diaminohydroxyphosphoribosylaminopyrimidine deaminase/5-amino-6-(5-phosphoribosylamino)uracil reductase
MSAASTMSPALRPRVTLHFAQSLDGRISLPGARAVLSSREGVELAHRARAEHDAVLVGSRTVQVDDPQLTVRACPGRQPRRVILASSLGVSSAARVLEGGPGVLVIGVQGRATHEARLRLEALGAQVRLVAAGPDGLVSLSSALAELRAWGVERLLVEGGARVLTAFLRERLADEMTVEIAPRLLGEPALVALGAIGVDGPGHTVGVADAQVELLGAHVIVRGRIAY